MKKIIALSKFELNIALDDKFVFVYTLLFPTIYFLYATLTHGTPAGNEPVEYQLLGFWAYIIVASVINGITAGTVSMRENNFLKMFTFITGNKRDIYYANLLPQLLIIQLELMIFNFIALVVFGVTPHLLLVMGISLLTNFIIIPIVAFFSSFILLLPLKPQSVSLITTGYLFLGLVMMSLSFNNNLLQWVLDLINPYDFVGDTYLVLFGESTDMVANAFVLSGITIFYLLIGHINLSKMSIQPFSTR